MKNGFLLGCVAFLLLNAAVYSQTGTWSQDYSKAAALAKSSGKILLMDFSGTDWCPWCIKLDKEVFSQKAFQDYAKKNLVLFLADFPRQKQLSEKVVKQNEALSEKFKIEYFPTVVLLSPKGERIGQTGYQPGGAAAYVKHLKELIAQNKQGKKVI